MTFNKISFFIILFFVLLVGALGIYNLQSKPNVAYINLAKVYDEFTLKKELSAKFETTKGARQHILDSLKLQLQILHGKVQENDPKYNGLLQNYYAYENQFAQDNQTLSLEYNDQVLKQLNQYVIDYGKKQNYDIIYGANGEGNIMYAKDMYDISEEVIVYINNRYLGAAQ